LSQNHLMRLFTLLVISLFGVLGANPLQAQSMAYALDPSHTAVHWEVKHFGTSTLRGRFSDIQGHIELNPSAGAGVVSIKLNTASVSTGVPVLDALLQNEDFFNTRAYPQAYFVARQLKFNQDKLQSVRGELTLRGISMPLQFRAAHFNCYQHPVNKKQVCGGDFEGELQRTEASITYGTPFVGSQVRVLIQIEATQTTPVP
jgi:polyisoprenoid-binding protein YceI